MIGGSNMKLFASRKVGDHLQIDFYDLSTRYYGDFHKVRILARAYFPPEQNNGNQQSVLYERTLEQMGVPTANLASARQRLADAFLENTGRYLIKPGFAEKCLERKIRSRQEKRGYFRN